MPTCLEGEMTGSRKSGKSAGWGSASFRAWFPIRVDMVLSPDFVRLSVCGKLVLLDINYRLAEHLSLAECGVRHGPFGEGDARWAKRLGMSIEAFRGARRKLGSLEWVVFTSGYRTSDGKLRRTEYHSARYCLAMKGVQSGAMYRRLWKDLIAALKKGELSHRDLVVAAFVCFFWKILGGREMGSITLPKAKVASIAGMPAHTFEGSLERLQKVTLSGERGTASLFTFRDKHRYGFQITNWEGGPDASRAGFSQPASTPDSVPLIAVLKSDTGTASGRPGGAGGDRGLESLQACRCRPWASHTHATAKLKGGWGSDGYQN